MSEKIPPREHGEGSLLKVLSVWAALHAVDGANTKLHALELPSNTPWEEALGKFMDSVSIEKTESVVQGVITSSGGLVWTYRQKGTRFEASFDHHIAANTLESVKESPEAICIVHNHLVHMWGQSLPPSSKDAVMASRYVTLPYKNKALPIFNSVVDPSGVWNFHKLSEAEAKRHFPKLSLKIADLKVDVSAIEVARQKWFALSPNNKPRDIVKDKKVATEYAHLREVFARSGIYVENLSIEDAKKGPPCGWKPERK